MNILVDKERHINFKIFKNGKIQLTGVSSELLAKKAVSIVIEYIKLNNNKKKIVDNIDNLKLIEYKTVLINSDYFCGVKLKRDNLYKILQTKYNLSVNYDSENYPGVKLQYFWNLDTINTPNEGLCVCKKKCIGKGDGNGENNCKKITISTFQSGKIIITGGRNLQQINNAYNYFNNILNNNYNDICRDNTAKSELNIKMSYFIKKKNIINFDIYDKLLE